MKAAEWKKYIADDPDPEIPDLIEKLEGISKLNQRILDNALKGRKNED